MRRVGVTGGLADPDSECPAGNRSDHNNGEGPLTKPKSQAHHRTPLLIDALSRQVEEQRRRLGLLKSEQPTLQDALEASLLEINVAHEELRVAQDELLAQQQEIQDLLDQQRVHGMWRERVSALLPVPVFVTDSAGSLLDANSVAVALLGIPESGLLHKSLASFVIGTDRRSLRQVIHRMAELAEQQIVVTLVPKDNPPVAVTLAGFSDAAPGPEEDQRYRWVAVPTTTSSVPVGHGPADSDEESEASAAVFAKLCRLPLEDDDPQRLLGRVATLGRTAVPHATGLSVSLGSPSEPKAMATDSSFAQAVDGVQFDAGEGPCVTAYETGRVTVTHDLTADPRWPLFSSRAAGVGARSALALPLQRGTDTIGVVNLYADEANVFTERDIYLAGLFCAAVGAVVQDVQEREALRVLGIQLKTALTSRAEIDQAKGIIMARHGCTADEAFARMVTISRHSNTKLRDLAASLVKTAGRSLPDGATGSSEDSGISRPQPGR